MRKYRIPVFTLVPELLLRLGKVHSGDDVVVNQRPAAGSVPDPLNCNLRDLSRRGIRNRNHPRWSTQAMINPTIFR